MKLRYREAVVSVCPDLTKSGATSFPVAVMLAGALPPLLVGGIAYLFPEKLRQS